MEQKKQSKQEMLAAIAEAVRRRQAGEDPYSDPNLKASLPPQQFPQPNIAPAKPDPERNANRIIEAAAAGGNRPQGAPPADVQAMMEARKGNPINPETGMPFFNAPQAPVEENPQDVERRQIRMQLLQEASRTGQMPAYLKKQ